ncbi:uncharacterized protein LOC122400565 [Colletes gigas]|uniref:uncharacterized protein LOC122400565 n=1 Tax=Colletes gigas TaxID=935657 RepID=UPI001C9B9F02|nr:uncharacterized protein LOC122400565 [Colletes gigas]
MFFVLSIFCMLRWCVVQAELDLMFDEAKCVYVNEEYFKPGSCKFEVNDDSEYGSSLTSRFEIIKEFPKGAMAAGNLKGIQMGEYTNDMGLYMEMDLCEIASGNQNIALPIMRALDVSGDNCPPKPGIYGKEGYVMDNFEGVPDSFPSGKYLLNISTFKDDVTIANYHFYLTVL